MAEETGVPPKGESGLPPKLGARNILGIARPKLPGQPAVLVAPQVSAARPVVSAVPASPVQAPVPVAVPIAVKPAPVVSAVPVAAPAAKADDGGFKITSVKPVTPTSAPVPAAAPVAQSAVSDPSAPAAPLPAKADDGGFKITSVKPVAATPAPASAPVPAAPAATPAAPAADVPAGSPAQPAVAGNQKTFMKMGAKPTIFGRKPGGVTLPGSARFAPPAVAAKATVGKSIGQPAAVQPAVAPPPTAEAGQVEAPKAVVAAPTMVDDKAVATSAPTQVSPVIDVEAGDRKKDTSRVPLESAMPSVGEKKKDTSRVPLESAMPAAGPAAGVIRMKKPSEGSATVPGMPKPAQPAMAQAVSSEKDVKKETSRVPLESAMPGPVGASQADVSTIKIKKPPSGPQTMPKPGAASIDDGSPKTIRLAKPQGMMGKKGETVRIEIGDSQQTPEMKADAGAEAGGQKTIKIKRPGDSAGAQGGHKTIKVARPGGAAPKAAAAGGDDAEEEEGDEGKSGGLTVKKHVVVSSVPDERAARLAKQEHELQHGRAVVSDVSREHWIWVVFSVAAIVVICVTMYVFATQLVPKSQNFNWPGRILKWNDPFFAGEGEWL